LRNMIHYEAKETVEKVTINAIASSGYQPQYEKINPSFSEKYPEITVNLEVVPYLDIPKKALLAHSANQDYDTIQVVTYSCSQLVSAGALAPLDELINKNNKDLSATSEEGIKLGTYDGKLYALIVDLTPRIIFYNKKIFKECGITDIPKTWEEFAEVCFKVKEKGYYAMAPEYKTTYNAINNLGGFALGDGTKFYVLEDGKYVAKIDTPEQVKYLNYMKSLYPTFAKDFNIDQTISQEYFIQGKAAMKDNTTGGFNQMQDKMENPEDCGTFLYPAGSVKSGSALGGWLLGIGAGSTKKDAAWKYIDFITTPEIEAQFAISLPADSGAYQFPPFNGTKYDIFIEQMKTAEFAADLIPVFDQVAEVYNNYFNEILAGQRTVEEGLKECNQEVQKILNTVNK
jgi:multiple sugar transport system substrate-binding protein